MVLVALICYTGCSACTVFQLDMVSRINTINLPTEEIPFLFAIEYNNYNANLKNEMISF